MISKIEYTDEELAIMAKEGDRDSLLQLWKQTYGFSYSIAMRYTSVAHKFGFEREDLMQEAFFGFLKTIKTFKPETGYAFVSFLFYDVKTSIRNAIGIKRKRFNVLSLNKPIGEKEDSTLVDVIADDSAEQEFHQKVDSIYCEQLRQRLEECFYILKPIEVQILRSRYFKDKTIEVVAREHNVSEKFVRRREEAAIRKLSRPTITKKLRFFLNAYIYS